MLKDQTGTEVSPRLLNERDAAKLLDISPRTMFKLRKRGDIPYLRVGDQVRYDIADIDAFIDQQRLQTTAPHQLKLAG